MKQLNEIEEKKLKENKCLYDAQENVNIRMIMKTIWDLKTEFIKEIEPLKRLKLKRRRD